MNRYLKGTYVLGADDVATAVVMNEATKKGSTSSSSGSDLNTIMSLAIAGVVGVVAWPWISRHL